MLSQVIVESGCLRCSECKRSCPSSVPSTDSMRTPVAEPIWVRSQALPDSEEDPDPEEGAAADREADVQLARALEVLKSWTYFDRLRKARAESVAIRSAEAASDNPAP